MIAEKEVKVKLHGTIYKVIVTLVGKCYNRLHFAIKDNTHEVVAWYDIQESSIEFPGMLDASTNKYYMALAKFLKQQGYEVR